MSLKFQYHIKGLRIAYRKYLEAKYPRLSSKSLSTRVDDAFCMFRWMEDNEAWYRVQLKGDELDAQCSFLADEFLSHRKNPLRDAKGYIRAVKEFQKFLELVGLIEDSRIRKPRKIQVDEDPNEPSNLLW